MRVYFHDETYGRDTTRSSDVFKRELEAEYGLKLTDGDIGPGAADPVLWAVIEDAAIVLVALFFLGDKIEKNWDAWRSLAKRLNAFRKRHVHFDRESSAVLAVDEVGKQIGRMPQMVQLEGYEPQSVFTRPLSETLNDTSLLSAIEGEVRKEQTVTIHVFQINTDEGRFKVFVYGNGIEVFRLS